MPPAPGWRFALTVNTTYRDFAWTGEGVGDMAVWYAVRTMDWRVKAVIAAGLLAVLLVAAVPVALFVGVVMMLLGHVAAGLALFGASVLTAAAAVVIAALSGVRQLRRLVASLRDYQVVQLRRGEYRYN
jgi:hypothetical protein